MMGAWLQIDTFVVGVPYMYFVDVLQLVMIQVLIDVYGVVGDGISFVMSSFRCNCFEFTLQSNLEGISQGVVFFIHAQ